MQTIYAAFAALALAASLTGCASYERRMQYDREVYQQMHEFDIPVRESDRLACAAQGSMTQAAAHNPRALIDIEAMAYGNHAAALCIEAARARAWGG